MKIWIIFGICVLTLVGCASAEYQKMQAERDQLLKNYEDLREAHNELKIKTDVTIRYAPREVEVPEPRD